MSFISVEKENEIKSKLVTDKSLLGKLYQAKKKEYIEISVDHNLVKDYKKEGWEEHTLLKTKTRLRKEKTHAKKLEDKVWCQFYELGYRTLNRDETFVLPFSNEPEDQKQIDVIAINNETIFIVECKSKEKEQKVPSYKESFEFLKLRIDGFSKVLKQIYGNDIKVKYIFATHNIRLDVNSEDMNRLKKAKAFYYNENTYEYINSLIKNYKEAAKYQFLGLILGVLEIPCQSDKIISRIDNGTTNRV